MTGKEVWDEARRFRKVNEYPDGRSTLPPATAALSPPEDLELMSLLEGIRAGRVLISNALQVPRLFGTFSSDSILTNRCQYIQAIALLCVSCLALGSWPLVVQVSKRRNREDFRYRTITSYISRQHTEGTILSDDCRCISLCCFRSSASPFSASSSGCPSVSPHAAPAALHDILCALNRPVPSVQVMSFVNTIGPSMTFINDLTGYLRM